jgi:RNA polymerase sigma-70 factor (ECF subfamily)
VTDVAALRPRLFGIAYRILGAIGDAEDVVQDAYIRWTERGGDDVRDPAGWLATVTARIAIDRGRTLARRRETYVGEWLPEPLIERDPADDVDVADDLTIGFLRVLERLHPDERTALLLHDAFDYSHAEVAAILERSEEAVRQMTSRARHRVHEDRPRFVLDRRAAEKAAQRFITALRDADVDALCAVLAEDVINVADGGGRVNAGRVPVVGINNVSRLLLGLRSKFWGGLEMYPAHVNGQPGILLKQPDGALFAAIGLDFQGDRISGIYAILNPDKLRSSLRSARDCGFALPSDRRAALRGGVGAADGCIPKLRDKTTPVHTVRFR